VSRSAPSRLPVHGGFGYVAGRTAVAGVYGDPCRSHFARETGGCLVPLGTSTNTSAAHLARRHDGRSLGPRLARRRRSLLIGGLRDSSTQGADARIGLSASIAAGGTRTNEASERDRDEIATIQAIFHV